MGMCLGRGLEGLEGLEGAEISCGEGVELGDGKAGVEEVEVKMVLKRIFDSKRRADLGRDCVEVDLMDMIL